LRVLINRIIINIDGVVKSYITQTALENVQDQGAQIMRNEAYLPYITVTKDAAQRRYWTFYEVVILTIIIKALEKKNETRDYRTFRFGENDNI